MTTEQIAKCALVGSLPEDAELDIIDEWLYYKLAEIYKKFQAGRIGQEEGQARKRTVLDRYDKARTDTAFKDRLIRHQSVMWREIESAGTAYSKDPTIENADKFLKAVYGVGRHVDAASN